MRILLCTEFYHDRGGGYAFARDSQRLLESYGHEVIPFAAGHPDNLPSPFAQDFVPYRNYLEVLRRRQWRLVPEALRSLISNLDAAAGIARLIRRYRPDVVHTHIIASYLTQVVWEVAHAAGVPVVHTLHDYKLLCPDTNLLSHGAICERCRGGRWHECALRRCKQGSFAASAAAAAQAYAQGLLRRPQRCVAAFVAPSEFIGRKHVEWGLRPEKVHHIPNFTWPQPPARHRRTGKHFLYCGRLSREKGPQVLVEAAREAADAEIVVAGDGEMREELLNSAPPNVQFLGEVPRDRVPRLLADALALVVPSIWYENCSLSVLEAFAAGIPVIGSNIGGIPEQVEHGLTGLLVPPGDTDALAEAIRALHKSPALARKLGRHAHAKAATTYSPSTHYQALLSLNARNTQHAARNHASRHPRHS